ncbi:hypothetical protein MRY87_08020 [bacterium]|nr:hypothetical protein [bacterium]
MSQSVRSSISRFAVAVCVSVTVCGVPFGQVSAEEEKKIREPETGTLAGFRSGGFEGLSLGVAGMEDQDMYSESSRPISGSVSRIGKRDWVAKVFNNSEYKYSVTIRVVEFDKRDKPTKNTSFSAILKPGEQWSREFVARANTEQAELQLTSFRNLSPKKKKEDEEKDSAQEE